MVPTKNLDGKRFAHLRVGANASPRFLLGGGRFLPMPSWLSAVVRLF